MSKTDMKDETNEYREPTCLGEFRGCSVAHCVHAKDCLDKQKKRDQEDHEAEVHDMQMAALGDERYI